MKRKQVDVWVITNHWGEYDYQGSYIAGIYSNLEDAENKLVRLRLHAEIEERNDPFAEPSYFTLEKQTATLEESCLNI